MSQKENQKLNVLCVGSINLDLFVNGLPTFPQTGAHATGENFRLGMGGKAANVAAMTKALSPESSVGLLSLLAQDPYGLWRIITEALLHSGIDQDFIQVVENPHPSEYQKLAVIMVNTQGVNNVAVVNGIADQLTRDRVAESLQAFELLGRSNGLVYVNLELLVDTLDYVLDVSAQHTLRVVCDPGGLQPGQSVDPLFEYPVHLLKPNTYEAERLSGILVSDFQTAQKAAKWLFNNGQFSQIFITHGKQGGYVFDRQDTQAHLPAPDLPETATKDETGCGDQVMATIIAGLLSGGDVLKASQRAITAGTLQFRTAGIVPVTKQAVDDALTLLYPDDSEASMT